MTFILRERQEAFVAKATEALAIHDNTIACAPTGAGKTVCLSAVIGRSHKKNHTHLVIQHRDELVEQNRKTFEAMNPGVKTAQIDADNKVWADGVNFGMIQTLIRNLDTMPYLSGITIDEAHHAAADSYTKVIHAAKEANPDLTVFGVTATPNRGDKKALRGVFSNCADQISITELIESGHLVKPRTFVIDVGVQEDLSRVRRSASDFDMSEVEAIMDKEVINARIVEEWKMAAHHRQTVVFCSTVDHAFHVRDAFRSRGINCECVHGDMPKNERRQVLEDYDKGNIEVLTNVAVLTEGWDHQPTSCIILLRPSSYKSTMIQMIGRGLRKVDPERYPGVQKDNCLVLDFGTSILTHGAVEQEINLIGDGIKDCPSCEATLPQAVKECPICGFEWPKLEGETKNCKCCNVECAMNAKTCWNCNEPFGDANEQKAEIKQFQMTEIDILDASPFKWHPMFGGVVLIASAFDAWAMVIKADQRFYAVAGSKNKGVKLIGDNADRHLSLASADDYLRENGDKEMASKSKRWLSLPMSDKQRQLLNLTPQLAFGINRYQATCMLTWKFQEKSVRTKLQPIMKRAA